MTTLTRLALVTLLGLVCGGAPRSAEGRAPEKPAILIPHPTTAFIESYINLRRLGKLPDARLILLTHEKQGGRVDGPLALLRRNGIRDVEVVRLSGFPEPAEADLAAGLQGGPPPELGWPHFRATAAPYLPPEWRRTFEDLVERTDALLMPGGSNIGAAFYGERQVIEMAPRSSIRTLFELSLLHFLLAGPTPYLERKPHYMVLGFCRGMQLINVALGGTLYQSIPRDIYGQRYVEDILAGDGANMHRNYHLALHPAIPDSYWGWFHPLRVVAPSSYVMGGEGISLLSNHQQAIHVLGRDLRIVATSADGRVPEIIAHTRFPNVLAVQGHPERAFAWKRLGLYPPATRRFHERFFRRVSAVLRENHRLRVEGAAPVVVAR